MTDLPRALFTTAEVAEMTGYSRQAIGNMCKRGDIQAIRIGGRGDYRIPARAVDDLRNGT